MDDYSNHKDAICRRVLRECKCIDLYPTYEEWISAHELKDCNDMKEEFRRMKDQYIDLTNKFGEINFKQMLDSVNYKLRL